MPQTKRWTATMAAAALVALAACGSPAGRPASPVPPAPTTAPAPTTEPSPTTAPGATTGPAPTPQPGRDDGADAGFAHVPLWPFADIGQARYWQDTAGPQGHQPWHADATFTATAFAQGFLGFADLDQVTSHDESGDESWVGVGYRVPNGGTTTAAVVHLARFGDGPGAPWEVVGTRDDTLTLDTPRYGGTVTSPITAGGRVTGVDESLRLQVRQIDRDGVLGEYCCLPAGGEGQPWTADVSFSGAGAGALTLVVSTGGHITDVERFAVTGLRPG